jgi:hypothetical protein
VEWLPTNGVLLDITNIAVEPNLGDKVTVFGYAKEIGRTWTGTISGKLNRNHTRAFCV